MRAVAVSFRSVGLAALLVAVSLSTAATCGAQTPANDAQLRVASMLVKNAVTAVNHGNLTGNYTVLRDLGAPTFQQRNSAAHLAVIFQKLREEKVDLSPVLILDPQFSEPPAINANGQLQLVGTFATQPLRVHFRVLFAKVNGGWMIDTISLGTTDVQPQQTVLNQAPTGPVSLSPPPLNYNVR